MDDLFRPEVAEAQRQQPYGQVILFRPVYFSFLIWLATSLAALIVCLLFFGHYTQRTRIHGKLLPNQEPIQIVSTVNGVMRNLKVREGQPIKAGEMLYEVCIVGSSDACPTEYSEQSGQDLSSTRTKQKLVPIIAPRDGLVAAINVTSGSIEPSQVTMIVLPLDVRLEAEFYVSAKLKKKVRIGQCLEIQYMEPPPLKELACAGKINGIALLPRLTSDRRPLSSTLGQVDTEPMYRVTVELPDGYEDANIGAPIAADIPGSRRTLINWLFASATEKNTFPDFLDP